MLERVKVFLAINFIWRFFPEKKREQVVSFANTEFITSWQFLYALRFLRGPKARAELFLQLLEEYHHTDLFIRLAAKGAQKPIYLDSVEIKGLYDGSEDLWRLLVFSHVGEEAAVARFSAIAGASGDKDLKRVLGEVLADEKSHARGISGMAELLGRERGEVESFARKVVLRRLFEGWVKVGSRVIDLLNSFILSGVYFIFGPILFYSCRQRMRETDFFRADSVKRAL